MPVDLSQGDISTRFSAGDYAIDAVDLVDIQSERLRHHRVDGQAGGGEGGVHSRHGARLA
jgi:hypothetical protein